MRKLLLVLSHAFLLSACSILRQPVPPSLPQPPPPPSKGLEPCRPSALPKQADGSMTRANSEGAIRQGDVDLAECDAKRQLLVDAWPRED